MVKCRVIANNAFFAGYGDVPPGVIIEMTTEDAFAAIQFDPPCLVLD